MPVFIFPPDIRQDNTLKAGNMSALVMPVGNSSTMIIFFHI